MASANVNSSWERIQHGVKDTERLIGQKEYNAAMVQSRQTLEFMVKLLANRVGLNDNQDLIQMIDGLYQHRAISKSTCEHYHKIRMIGNKAVHEGDASAYNANQAYHILAQEVYSFANDYRNAQRGSRRPSGGSSHTSTRSRKRQAANASSFQIYTILKILIPVLCIILLVLIVKLVKSPKDSETQSNPTTQTSETMTNTPVDTPPVDTVAPTVVYRTTSNLNVRAEPSTDATRLGQIPGGTEVDYQGEHNEEWAIIMYDGQQAYVNSSYLTTE